MRFLRLILGLAFAGALAASGPSARADDGSKVYVGGLKLVWGSVPMPDTSAHIGISNTSITAPRLAPATDFAMTFSLPDDPGRHFLFSPSVPPVAADLGTPGANRAYLGLSLGLASSTGLYGSLGFGGSIPAGSSSSFEEANRRFGNAPLLLHGGLELGYHLTGQQNLSVNIDRAAPTDGTPDRTETGGSFRLRYGLKF